MVVLRTLALSAILAASAMPAFAAPSVEAAWTRPAAQGGMGGGYMTLRNPDAKADALVSVQSPLARDVQMHESSMSGGVASMKQVLQVAVPAGGTATFKPGGYHLMFVGLSKALKVGDGLPATLTFASGAKIKVTFVTATAPPAAGHAHH